MPLYEYKCHRCGQTFEVLQKFADAPLTEHENCGGEVERLLSAPALQFKGSGWYVTDYGRGGKSPAGGSNGKSESKSDSSGEGKSAGKTAGTTAAESKPASPAPSSDSK